MSASSCERVQKRTARLLVQLAPQGASSGGAGHARGRSLPLLREALARVDLESLLADGEHVAAGGAGSFGSADEAGSSSGGTVGAVNVAEWVAGAGSWTAVSGAVAVSQARIDAFSAVTLDPQWIHGAEAGLAGSPYGTPIAHGFLVLSLLSPLAASTLPPIKGMGMGINYGLNRVRFVAPTRVGAAVHASVALAAVKRINGGGIESVLDVSLVSSDPAVGDKPVVVAQWLVRHYP
ncbi:acyl dehydratase [Thecamonas trahens ATCC 50062]|uniref:Acyl dehydratase n=1 Tax=Thecamonas trahens ATCC 50062 TaxID=461836 RepID=A0A0L0DRI9_THETB|nr:acyl dehydratase [Thecamonas trahens ATCC 50062]KNC54877.1 acyl dehydratase [Thecamonas trahens ATCC 50062]|eukprot:XP_013753473.1 acyl dehydratase [Thecamonas trahens ATCC 50062]